MFILTITTDNSAAETAFARLTAYAHQGWTEQEEDNGSLRLGVHFSDETEARMCAIEFPGSEIIPVEERNWAGEWQAQWEPILVGQRFFLAPSWTEAETPAGRIRLEMRPGLVFGGGDHPTTQLCLELLESATRPGVRMADIGCGTAILAQAALALGARAVTGCDIDPSAVDAAIESRVPVFEGSVDAIAANSIDLLAANLPTGVLMTLMPEFLRVLAPGGCAILSGYLAEQREMLFAEARAHGFHVESERERDDWAACRIARESR